MENIIYKKWAGERGFREQWLPNKLFLPKSLQGFRFPSVIPLTNLKISKLFKID